MISVRSDSPTVRESHRAVGPAVSYSTRLPSCCSRSWYLPLGELIDSPGDSDSPGIIVLLAASPASLLDDSDAADSDSPEAALAACAPTAASSARTSDADRTACRAR